jgi:hypothetical protein
VEKEKVLGNRASCLAEAASSSQGDGVVVAIVVAINQTSPLDVDD